jgi:hypothetical protein
MTREEAVKTATEELVKLMAPLQGLNKLEGMRRVKGDSWSFKSSRDMLCKDVKVRTVFPSRSLT